ncbi:MAG TPA: aspartate kinase, partial [Bacteroidia bacterium]
MKVFKFGGASVKDAESVRNVGRIIAHFSSENLLVVISAMGKTTNKLEELVMAFWKNNDNKSQIIAELKDFHFNIAKDLITDPKHHIFSDLEDLFMELECLVEKRYPNAGYDEIYDGVICYGELLSTKIVSDYLMSADIKNKWVDARNFIQTDSTFREA